MTDFHRRRADERVAGLARPPGLHADGTWIGLQQQVLVEQAVIVPVAAVELVDLCRRDVADLVVGQCVARRHRQVMGADQIAARVRELVVGNV